MLALAGPVGRRTRCPLSDVERRRRFDRHGTDEGQAATSAYSAMPTWLCARRKSLAVASGWSRLRISLTPFDLHPDRPRCALVEIWIPFASVRPRFAVGGPRPAACRTPCGIGSAASNPVSLGDRCGPLQSQGRRKLRMKHSGCSVRYAASTAIATCRSSDACGGGRQKSEPGARDARWRGEPNYSS